MALAFVALAAGAAMSGPVMNLFRDRPLETQAAPDRDTTAYAANGQFIPPVRLAPRVTATAGTTEPQVRALEPQKRIPARRTQSPPPRSAVSRGACGDLAGHDRRMCMHSRVMAADRSLRRAYSAATRAGVSRATLVEYRRRWSGLRGEAVRNPGRVIAGYTAMARDLRRQADRAQRT